MSDLHSLVGPFVTDSLDDDERGSFELHLENCVDCRGEVLDLQETMAEMSALHEMAPPPDLRSSILSAISSTPMLPAEETSSTRDTSPSASVPLHSSDGVPGDEDDVADDAESSNVVRPDFGRSRRPVVTWLAAAAAFLVVALSGVTVWQQSELRSVQAADAQRVQLLAAADLQVSRTNLEGTDLTYLVSQSREEALIMSTGFPAPGEERSWQVWVIDGEAPTSAGVIDEGGQLQVSLTGLPGGQLMAITNEPRGGSTQPTGEVQAAVELQAA